MPLIDLASDTATRPSDEMWSAMRSAPLGDEQRREDPTTLKLEERVASMLGKDRALLLPSATMANQIAIALQTKAGDEVLVDKSAHIVHYEAGYTSVIARAQLKLLEGHEGIFSREQLEGALRDDDPHYPDASLIVVENTSNRGGGKAWSMSAWQEVVDFAQEHQIALHVDGARFFNATTVNQVSPLEMAKGASTIQLCFSKGLGCPFGAVLAMNESHFRQARKIKQGLGGALRQSGVVAAAMLYALDHELPKLQDDHRRAALLREALTRFPELEVEKGESNLVFFKASSGKAFADDFCSSLLEHGVRMGPASKDRVRACLHRDVDDQGIQVAISSLQNVISHLSQGGQL